MERDSDIALRLWRLGHLHNPSHPTGIDPFDERDAAALTRTDQRFQSGVLSYMEWFDEEMEQLCQAKHGRSAKIDGDAGPAFEALMDDPRCEYPDYMASAKQEANWPDACRRKLRIGRDFDALPGLTKEETDMVWWASANNWTTACADMEIEVAEVGDRDCQVFATLKRLRGSMLAWSYLAQNDCRAELDQAFQSARQWARDYAATTKSHEDGHAWGHPHVQDRNALMFPSINSASVSRIGFPNETDLAQAKRLGYKLSGKPQLPENQLFRPRDEQPDDPDPPDDPDDPPTDPAEYWFRHSVELMQGNTPLGEYILKPKARI